MKFTTLTLEPPEEAHAVNCRLFSQIQNQINAYKIIFQNSDSSMITKYDKKQSVVLVYNSLFTVTAKISAC